MIAAGRLAALGVAALVVAGCAVPHASSTGIELDVPRAWRSTPDAGTSASSDARWWRGFGDPALDALVDDVRSKNVDLRVARSRIAEYESRLVIARSALSPALNFSAGPTRARSRTSSGGIATDTVYQVGVQASYEVDLWGRLRELGDAAMADLQAQHAARDSVALSVTATAASGYVNLLGLDAQLALARATLASREASLQRARRLYDTGYSSRLDWAQAQSEYRTAASAVPVLERAVAQQETALALLAGRNPGSIERGRNLKELVSQLPDAGVPSRLVRRRPDIAQAEYRLVSADHSLAAARDQLLPALQLSGSATLLGLTPERLVDAPTTLWSLGASVLAPLLQRERLEAASDIAAVQRDQALLGYEQTVRNAFGEVENALVATHSLQEQDRQAEGREAAARDLLSVASNRYRNGYSSYLEELDAQRTLLTAQQNALQIRTALLIAEIDLYRALGGGWES